MVNDHSDSELNPTVEHTTNLFESAVDYGDYLILAVRGVIYERGPTFRFRLESRQNSIREIQRVRHTW